MSWERYIRRLGAWRALVYIAIAVTALALVLVAQAATVGPAAPVVTGEDSQGSAGHAARVGQSAPTFSGKNSQGKTVSLDQYRGKYVVLEWTNRACPFTKKHYDSGNMQTLQQQWTGKGVV